MVATLLAGANKLLQYSTPVFQNLKLNTVRSASTSTDINPSYIIFKKLKYYFIAVNLCEI